MKIFDFSEGKKGELLADDMPKATGKFGLVGNTEVSISRYRFCRDCQYHAADYGVEAICFCVGKVVGGEEDEWEWWFTADLSWVLSYRHRWDTEKTDLIYGTKTLDGKPLSISSITRDSELFAIINEPLDMELSIEQVVKLLNHTILLNDGTVIKKGAITEAIVDIVNRLHQVKAK